MSENQIRQREAMAILEMIDGMKKSNMSLDTKTVEVIKRMIRDRIESSEMFAGKTLTELPEI